jgi:multisubunit Na+/H+ antiporter MnhB subunit
MAAADAHVHVAPGGGPLSLMIGIVMVIFGLTVIVRPAWFRRKPVWNPDQPLPPLNPVQTAISQSIGVVVCVVGVGVFILGIAILA